MQSSATIGIDLGTTFSCVAAFHNGKIEVIANNLGSRTTRSCVAFTKAERLFGEAALNHASMNPSNVIFDIKRLIGREFCHTKREKYLQHWPFVVSEISEKPMIEIDANGTTKHLHPEEISAMVLEKMKEMAETFLGQTVNRAVISVPAHFNNHQRQATINAAKIAGLEVLRIINEPTAAAIAYAFNKQSKNEETVLVFDLGGGTLDVSIVSIANGKYKVKSTAGAQIGGEDFDNRLVDHVIGILRNEHKVEVSENKRALRRLRTACEKAKRALSLNTDANVDILFEGNDYTITVDRARFEDLNSDYFQTIDECLKKALKYARVERKAIDEIVLVGGSSRIPKVQQNLQNFFGNKKLNKTINVEEAVASGAAIYAAESLGIVLEDVAPYSIERPKTFKASGYNSRKVIFPEKAVIPKKVSKKIRTRVKDKTFIEVPIYEKGVFGEIMLSKLCVSDVELGKEIKFKATFSIDANGMLSVTAEHKSFKKVKKIENIQRDFLMDAQIKQMNIDAMKFRSEDQDFLKRKEAKVELEEYCIKLRNDFKSKTIDSTEHGKAIDKVFLWLDKTELATEDEYKSKIKSLFDQINSSNTMLEPKAPVENKRRARLAFQK